MKLLTSSREIRDAIRDLMSDAQDDRKIAVAYVGADALKYLPNASGVIVYCWPQPGGTNPHGVEELLQAEATVHFVERLHAKVFWSRKNGTILGVPVHSMSALLRSGRRVRIPSASGVGLGRCGRLSLVRLAASGVAEREKGVQQRFGRLLKLAFQLPFELLQLFGEATAAAGRPAFDLGEQRGQCELGQVLPR